MKNHGSLTNLKDKMSKKYLYKVYSGVNTFSNFPAGNEFRFSAENFSPQIQIQIGDIIVAYSNPGTFCILEITGTEGYNLSAVKNLELFKEKFINFDSGTSILELTEIDYSNLLVELLLKFSTISPEDNTENISTSQIISSFAKWLNAKPKNNYFDNDYIKTVSFLTKLQEKYSEIYSKDIFDVDFDDLDNFIEKINTNIWDQSTDFWRYSEAASNHQPRAILNKDNYQAFLKEFKYKRNHNFQPKNTIYYGAPGTGKSYRVDQIIKDLDPKYFERVTFHPDYDNASFVGGYKPVSQKNEKGDEEIGYRFVPQAFSTIYSRAWQDPTHQYYLVIEEINRGNCAEIFGEIFQLLDRNSEYTVTPSRELREHLLKDFSDNPEHEGIRKGLKLPSNLHILATMNTSDQSLFPMDSAFKRRWEWEYVLICYDPKTEEDRDNLSFGYEIELPDGTKYRWIDFISKINNNHIKNNPSLGMDKCIGNYFIKPDSGNFISLKPFISKVIFYLWNDVFKDEDNKVFESNGSYEDFFPIASAGVTKVKELFERIELSPISVYAERDEEYQLGQVAEENQTVEN